MASDRSAAQDEDMTNPAGSRSFLGIERHGPLPETHEHEFRMVALELLAKLEQEQLRSRPWWRLW
jgi:hypothetical protein